MIQYKTEYVVTLTPSEFPAQKLKVEVGMVVMLLRNVCIKEGLN
jgi:hypothetical protein